MAKKKIEEFDNNHYYKLLAIQKLLIDMTLYYTKEMDEYLEEFGLNNLYKNDIATLDRNYKFFFNKIKRYICIPMQRNMNEDFDKLREIIDKFLTNNIKDGK